MVAALLVLPFLALLVVTTAHGPASHAPADVCTRACHDRGCIHLTRKVDTNAPVVRAARSVYRANIRALHAPSLGYRDTNLLVYVLGMPTVCAVLLLIVLAREPSRRHWVALAGLLAAGAVMVASVAGRPGAALAWGTDRDAVYWMCTDFCVHIGNRTGLTYEGFNVLLFLVTFPATLLVLATAAFHRLIAHMAGSRHGYRGT